MNTRRFATFASLLALCIAVSAQTQFTEPTRVYLMHSSGNHLKMASDYGGMLEGPKVEKPQCVTFIPDGQGYYNIKADTAPRYLALLNQWNTSFITDSESDNAKYAIEAVDKFYVRLRCKANNRYLGTDADTDGSKVYTDKDGQNLRHHWYFSTDPTAEPPADTITYLVAPQVVRQHFTDGWGVSLCWWAGQCGKWDDKKIDEIVNWLTSPTGLNYNIFRYNIGGGDDPENHNCTLHHMGGGKGLRAEMEGFKDFSGDEYHWDRDAAQRKILLKIHEKRPDAIFEAFSNSCPWYMTYSGCVSGSTDGSSDNLRPEYYEEFAHYLVDVCSHYKDEYGIEFKTLEPFNESVTGFWYANGVQEGCHFDYASQIKFIKVLKPILDASGLNTVISASDETNVGLAVEGFRQYQSAGIMPQVGQWNTHTYSGSIADRTRMAQLAHQADVPLWMSEVGSGGSGIGGNLSLTQRLFDDMRYLQPIAWVDWQYMEEANDQWCTIRGSFSQQTYNKVKNFYVRQQCTRFIRRGYNIIASLCNQTLAATNEAGDTLVLVMLNEGGLTTHRADLSLFDQLPVASRIRAYRTSETENLATVRSFKLDGSVLTVNLPPQSITTIVMPVGTKAAEEPNRLNDGTRYLIIPRNETTRAITAPKPTQVTIEDIDYSNPAQQWTATLNTDGTYTLTNQLGYRLTAHRTISSSLVTAQANNLHEQAFKIEDADYPYRKILVAKYPTYAIDLSNEGINSGTKVDTWQYTASTNTPSHRQWMFVPLTASQEADAIDHITPDEEITNAAYGHSAYGIYTIQGYRISADSSASQSSHQLAPGIYIVRKGGKTQKIVVK
ncbi:MAG: hypothetical protein IJ139_10135 [Bacteroidaceae bacterium]|nr:hypothetical protein [Bacteroidaceae bacterium]